MYSAEKQIFTKHRSGHLWNPSLGGTCQKISMLHLFALQPIKPGKLGRSFEHVTSK